jgi:hypothetical protein
MGLRPIYEADLHVLRKERELRHKLRGHLQHMQTQVDESARKINGTDDPKRGDAGGGSGGDSRQRGNHHGGDISTTQVHQSGSNHRDHHPTSGQG